MAKHIVAKYTTKELQQLAEDSNACVTVHKSTYNLALYPYHLSDLKLSIKEILNANVAKYDKKFGGIVLGYKNIKVLQREGLIITDSCFIHFDVEGEFYIFKPEIGSTLYGTVNKVSKDHVSCLVNKMFNVSVPKRNNEGSWQGNKVKIGDCVLLKVTQINLETRLPYIRTSFVPKNKKKKIKSENEIEELNDSETEEKLLETTDEDLLNSESVVPSKKKKNKQHETVELEELQIELQGPSNELSDSEISKSNLKSTKKKKNDLNKQKPAKKRKRESSINTTTTDEETDPPKKKKIRKTIDMNTIDNLINIFDEDLLQNDNNEIISKNSNKKGKKKKHTDVINENISTDDRINKRHKIIIRQFEDVSKNEKKSKKNSEINLENIESNKDKSHDQIKKKKMKKDKTLSQNEDSDKNENHEQVKKKTKKNDKELPRDDLIAQLLKLQNADVNDIISKLTKEDQSSDNLNSLYSKDTSQNKIKLESPKMKSDKNTSSQELISETPKINSSLKKQKRKSLETQKSEPDASQNENKLDTEIVKSPKKKANKNISSQELISETPNASQNKNKLDTENIKLSKKESNKNISQGSISIIPNIKSNLKRQESDSCLQTIKNFNMADSEDRKPKRRKSLSNVIWDNKELNLHDSDLEQTLGEHSQSLDASFHLVKISALNDDNPVSKSKQQDSSSEFKEVMSKKRKNNTKIDEVKKVKKIKKNSDTLNV